MTDQTTEPAPRVAIEQAAMDAAAATAKACDEIVRALGEDPHEWDASDEAQATYDLVKSYAEGMAKSVAAGGNVQPV